MNSSSPSDFAHVTVDLELGFSVTFKNGRILLQIVEQRARSTHLQTGQTEIDDGDPHPGIPDPHPAAVYSEVFTSTQLQRRS